MYHSTVRLTESAIFGPIFSVVHQMYHSTVRPAESAIFGPILSVGHQITQEAVCANTAYKRHFTAKCHNLDSLAI